jgi:hypothetical protein
MASALQLPVEFVEYDVAEQGRKWTPCGVPSTLGLTNPFSITPAFKNARISVTSRLSSTRCSRLLSIKAAAAPSAFSLQAEASSCPVRTAAAASIETTW